MPTTHRHSESLATTPTTITSSPTPSQVIAEFGVRISDGFTTVRRCFPLLSRTLSLSTTTQSDSINGRCSLWGPVTVADVSPCSNSSTPEDRESSSSLQDLAGHDGKYGQDDSSSSATVHSLDSDASSIVDPIFSEASASTSPPESPPPLFCHNAFHCRLPQGHVDCGDPEQWQQCPSLSGHIQGVMTCHDCRNHGNAGKRAVLRSHANYPPGNVGVRAQLCETCIKEEVILYWLRVGQAPPTVANTTTLQYAQSWPSIIQPIQDLCMCNRLNVAIPRANCCHPCRDWAFNTGTTQHSIENEATLARMDVNYITGYSRLNGSPFRPENQRALQRRHAQGTFYRCPCGKPTKQPIAPMANEYITYCLACMGVRINGNNLPTHLTRAALFRHGLTPRVRDSKVHKVRRSPRFRVNIERAWMEFDELIGGV